MSKIIKLFTEICKIKSKTPAFYYYEDKQITCKNFADIGRDVDSAVQYLCEVGVRANDKLLAFASADYNLVIFILAAFKIGASVMYIDVFAKQDTFASLFQKYKPNYVLTSNRTNLLRFLFPQVKQIQYIINVDIIKKCSKPESSLQKISFEYSQNIPEDQIALLTTTTGSTTKPKIVVRTHKDLWQQLELIQQNIMLPEEPPVILTTSYIYVFANLLQGFTTVLPNLNLRRTSAALNRKLQEFQNIGINMILTSPDFCLKTGNFYPNLEYLYFGGAIINLVEAQEIFQKFHPARIIYTYGCTECNLISTIPLGQYIANLRENKTNNLGSIVRGVKVKIGTDDEICVQSEARTDHYLDNNSKPEEFYDTSDRGYIENNQLFYLGKANGILRTSSGIVYSSEVEQNLVLQFGFSKCAFLEHERKFYLFLEKPRLVSSMKVECFIKEKYKIAPVIRYIRKIPCDIKHHTKIDYQKLREKLK